MNFKDLSIAKVSVNRNVVIVPKTKDRQEEWIVAPHSTAFLHSMSGKMALHVLVTNAILLDGKNIGQFDAQTVFELNKDWAAFTEEEKINLMCMAFHTPAVMLLQQARDEVALSPTVSIPPRDYLLKIIDNVRVPAPPIA